MADAAGKQATNTGEASGTDHDKVDLLLGSDIQDGLRNSTQQRRAIDLANPETEPGELIDGAFHQLLCIAGQAGLPDDAPGSLALAHVKDKDFRMRGTCD